VPSIFDQVSDSGRRNRHDVQKNEQGETYMHVIARVHDSYLIDSIS